MRLGILAVFLVCLAATAGCSEECSTEQVPVCDAFETADHVAPAGHWEGTYNVDRYMIGDNDLYMDWDDGAYTLYLKRDAHFWRQPFYRDDDFSNTGVMGLGQTNFKIRYRPGEWWYFTGKYAVSGGELVYRGTIHTAGQWIGRFSMRRKRYCVEQSTRDEEVCRDVPAGFVFFPLYSLPATDDVARTEFTLSTLTVEPNPVTTSGRVHIRESAAPKATRLWSVWVAPTAQPTAKTSLFYGGIEALDMYADAPTGVGAYQIGVQVGEGLVQQTRTYALSVTAP